MQLKSFKFKKNIYGKNLLNNNCLLFRVNLNCFEEKKSTIECI